MPENPCLFAASNKVGHVLSSAAISRGCDTSKQWATSCSVLKGLINLMDLVRTVNASNSCENLHSYSSTPKYCVNKIYHLNL